MTALIPETIETDRLRFAVIRTETVDPLELYEICSADPGIETVTEYMPWEPHATPDDTVEFIDHVDEQYQSDDGASYLIRPREGEEGAGTIAGTAGFSLDWEKRTMTMGVWLRKPFWGRGYSRERATAFIELAFDRFDLELVAITVLPENERSIRAIEKYIDAYGGQRAGRLRNWLTIDGEPADCLRYSISRSEWEANRSEATVVLPDA